jgi:hypothetical protein
MDAGLIILTLKIAVAAVTVLWIGSLIALGFGSIRWHGRINLVFFFLTISAVIGLEVVTRIVSPDALQQFLEARQKQEMLNIHLSFSMPAAVVLFVMLFTGLKHKRNWHVATGILFSILWIGTFITGIFFLPHE